NENNWLNRSAGSFVEQLVLASINRQFKFDPTTKAYPHEGPKARTILDNLIRNLKVSWANSSALRPGQALVSRDTWNCDAEGNQRFTAIPDANLRFFNLDGILAFDPWRTTLHPVSSKYPATFFFNLIKSPALRPESSARVSQALSQ